MIIALLGRQPALGIAELERSFGSDAVSWFSDQTARVTADALSAEHFGGVQKAGRVVAELSGDWQAVSKKIIQAYTEGWSNHDGKITLGISAYGFPRVSSRDVQKTGIVLKSRLKKSGVSLRLVPNSEPALSSATSHHNKLGLSGNKVELLIVRNSRGDVVVAESLGAQNITALAARDQGRPKRDAFVGMLPPKLALQMVNLAAGQMEYGIWNMEYGDQRATSFAETSAQTRETTETESGCTEDCLSEASSAGALEAGKVVSRRAEAVSEDEVRATTTILDPFCGTGVVLQEALLRGFRAYGTDLSAKMIDYSQANLEWLRSKYHLRSDWLLGEGDAMTTKWHQPIDAVACESYLGQPFSAPPSPVKLREVRGNCNHIISTFLKNLASQIPSGTPLCIAVPAWRDTRDNFTHLPLIQQLDTLGYQQVSFKNVTPDQLLYYRENQVVARELLVMTRK